MASIGSIIAGKYEIVHLIGEGGMSRVYLAMDTKLNKQWAIKEIKPGKNPIEQEFIRESLVSETNMIKQLDHPALPRVVDIFNEHDILYVVMDYIEGVSLSRVLQEQGAQDQQDVIEWGKQLCDALDYLHERTPPVIYRDMKPGNVMLKPDGTVKVIDFGIAREYREERADEKGLLDDTTTLGTRGYAAPEQFGGFGQTDARTDIYCLGATLYHLLTGKSPAEPPYVMHPIRQINSNLSPGLEKIISKATQQNPDDRYSSCAEMLYELEHFETVDDAYRKKLKRKWNAFIAVCASAVFFSVLGVFGIGMAEQSKSQDYDLQLTLAQTATNQAESIRYYQHAISLKPENTRAYLELVDLFKQDARFSTSEESHLLASLMPNISILETQGEDYAELSFEIGKLYWYYYDYASEAGDNRLTRANAAEKWLDNAATNANFKQADLAGVYSSIASFYNEIVAHINEGDDAGLYKPYFYDLEKLVRVTAEQQNDVVLLETSGFVGDALQTYARKFRADGIEKTAMEELYAESFANANLVVPTSYELDQAKKRVLDGDELVREAIQNAFVDAREIV